MLTFSKYTDKNYGAKRFSKSHQWHAPRWATELNFTGKMVYLTSVLYSSGPWITVIQCLRTFAQLLITVMRSSVLLLVSAFLVLLVLQGRAQLLDEHWQDLVQWVHHTPLQPLGNGSPGVVEAKFLQDVVNTNWVDLTSCPGDKPEGRGNITCSQCQMN